MTIIDQFVNEFRRERRLAAICLVGTLPCVAMGAYISIHELFYNTPSINGINNLSTAILYIQKYEGKEPSYAIGNAYEMVDVVKDMNPGEEDIKGLEKELKALEAKADGVDNPLFYDPILSDAVTAISDYSRGHSRTAGTVLVGLGTLTAALPLSALFIAALLPSAEERERRNGNAYQARRRQSYDNDIHPDQDDPFRNHDQ
jgi:hypothetical protein